MPVSAARAAAFDILLRVEEQNAFASELLHSSQFAQLSPADHGLCTELVMGVLRWRSSLDTEIVGKSSKKLEKLDREILTALRLGVYQLTHLQRIPARAAINESVELVKRARKRSAAPFVNAVLRKLDREPGETNVEPSNTSPAYLAERYAHPLWLVERWWRNFGPDATREICDADQQVPITVIRLRDPGAESELRQEGIQLVPGALLSSALRVTGGEVTRTKAFREGRVAIQDEASQLVAMLVGKGNRILDCCASPGGKTSVIASRNLSSTIVAADIHPHRARLARRLVAASNVHVIVADAEHLPVAGTFDRGLADVPCSGTGTLARNPEIKWRLKPSDLADLHQRQVAILRSALGHLTSKGRLVYSTCSLEPEENQDVIKELLAKESGWRLLPCGPQLEELKINGELAWPNPDSLTDGGFLRTLPGIHPCDGFFAAIIERN